MHKNEMTDAKLSEFLTELRQSRRDGLLNDSVIAEFDKRGISWVDFNSSPEDYRKAVAERLEELDIDNGLTHVERNRDLVAHLQSLAWQPFEVAEAAIASENRPRCACPRRNAA